MKSNKNHKLIIIVLILAFIGIIGLEKFTKPIPLTFADAVKEVSFDNEKLEITFTELVSDYEINSYQSIDDHAGINSLSDNVIIAWNSPLSKYVKSGKVDNIIIDVDNINNISYSEIENDGKNIVMFEKNITSGSSSILPRLAMNYYFIITAFISILSLIMVYFLRDSKKGKWTAIIISTISLSYITSSIIILGFNQITYFIIRDLSYVIATSLVLSTLTYTLLKSYKYKSFSL